MDKSLIMLTQQEPTPSDQLKFAFRVVKDLTLLGAAIVPNGVMNPTILDLRVVMPLMSKIQAKLKAVLISSHYKRLRLDVALHLMESQAMSVLKYVLPLTPHNGIAVDMLNKMLQTYAMDSIGGHPVQYPHV
jgi:hypothetical protein